MKHNKRHIRYICGEIVFYLHLPIFLFWVIPFFMPASLWADRVTVHFFYIISVVFIEVISGLWMYPAMAKFDLVCPVTVLMQWVRGYAWNTPEAYTHTFLVEFFERLHITCQKKTITILIILTVLLVTCQYFFRFPFV